MIGYVYIMINTAFPDLIKIGRTIKSSSERASELYTTGTPGKFVVVYDVLVDDCIEVERVMHELIGDKRYSNNREFFHATTKEAIELLQEITTNRKIDENQNGYVKPSSSSIFEGELSKYYLYVAFIGNPNSSSIYHSYKGDSSNFYRFGFYQVAQTDNESAFYDCDVDSKMKYDLRSDLAKYYNSFGNFNFSEKSVQFIESGTLTLFAEIDHSLLNRNAKLQLEKVLKETLAKSINSNEKGEEKSENLTGFRDALSGWTHVFDEQTLAYQGSNGFNDDGSGYIYYLVYSAVNDFCETLHQRQLKYKAEEKNREIRNSLKGNF